MRAARFHEYGGIDKIVVEDVPDPEPQAHEVKIKVGACALNHLDVDFREGVSRFPVEPPVIFGLELAGEIVETGAGVSDAWKVGDRVAPYLMGIDLNNIYARTGRENLAAIDFIGVTRPGGYAEYSCIPESHLVRIPDGMSFVDAAAVQIAFGTAFHMLFTRGRLAIGETVLINSVGSGIGSAAVQLAALAGARIIGTSSGDDKLEAAAKMGMNHGINYTKQDIVEEVMRITDGAGAHLTYEHVGGDLFAAGLNSLGKDGRLVTCGAHSGEVVPVDIIPLFRMQWQIIGSFTYTKGEYEMVMQMCHDGRLKPLVDTEVPLDGIRSAFERMESRGHFGKIVVVP
ncbi:MAG: zinc-binding dehydrogenase [Actinobacteria bacterium]|nr:zinc-binding dehydrogenase [Actinomycetota bacterium]